MTWIRITVFSFFLLAAAVQGQQSVWDALKASSEPIDQFRTLIEETSQQSYLTGTTCSPNLCNSVFIPTNAAMARAYPSGTASLSADQKKALVQTHICHLFDKNERQIKLEISAFTTNNVLIRGKKINFGSNVEMGRFITPAPASAGSGTLYWTNKVNGSVTTYYVNNALLKTGSQKSVSGGTFHVIHDVILPVPLSQSVYSYLQGNRDKFSDFLKIYEDFRKSSYDLPAKSLLQKCYESVDKASMTSFFIPENTGFAKIPTATIEELRKNATSMYRFLVSHMAYNQLVFMSWMRNTPPINLKMELPGVGTPPLSFDAKMYSENNATSNYISSGGVTAIIRAEGQPLDQRMLFRISEPLNFLYTDVTNILRQQSSSFLTACLGNLKCKAILQSGNVTVFAPPNAPLPSLNSTLTEKLLLLHLLPNSRLSTPEMRQGMTEKIADVGELRFLPGDKDAMSISGRFYNKVSKHGYNQSYVGARVVTPNLAGKDGIVHVLSNALGHATESIYSLLGNKFGQFSELIKYLGELDITPSLKTVPENGQHYTFFAPTNAALAKMTDNTGQKILKDKVLRNQLLKRLILLNVVVVSSLTVDQEYSAVTALPYANQPNEHAKIKLLTSMNRQKRLQAYVQDESVTVSFFPADSEWGCTNGVVYALDTVPYNAKSAFRVCTPGTTTCGGPRLFSSEFLVLLITAAAAMVLRLN